MSERFAYLLVLVLFSGFCDAQQRTCSSALGNVSQCGEISLSSQSVCGMNLTNPPSPPTCTNCSGRPSGSDCPLHPTGREPCMFNLAESTCRSSGFNCSYYPTQAVCNSGQAYEGSANCAWDTNSNVCTNCSAFSAANCPDPQCILSATSASCVAVGSVCYEGARNSPQECGAAGTLSGCYYDLSSSECIPCQFHRSASSCTASAPGGVCVWNADQQICGHRPACATFTVASCPAGHCHVPSGGSCTSPLVTCGNLFGLDTACRVNGATVGCIYDTPSTACIACLNFNEAECPSYSNCSWSNSAQLCLGRAVGGAGNTVAASTALSTTSIILIAVFSVAGGVSVVFALVFFCVLAKKRRTAVGDADESGAAVGSAQVSLPATVRLSNLRLTMPTGVSASTPRTPNQLALQAPALFQDGRVQRLKLLGRGANGSVYSCMLPDGTLIAMKEILLPSAPGDGTEVFDAVMKEVSIVSSLDHANVVRFYGSALEPEERRLTIFMEMIPNGSLASMVRAMEAPMREDVATVYVRQMVSALAYIHGRGVVHRDLKCDNLLVTGEGLIKLTDFGASKIVGMATMATRAAQTMVGTPHFMAPEILVGGDDGDGTDSGYGRRADIWSLGITVVEMMECGKAPWPAFPSTGAAFMHIATPGSLPIIPARFSNEARDFVLQCCRRDPLERPTSQALLSHPWIAETVRRSSNDATPAPVIVHVVDEK